MSSPYDQALLAAAPAATKAQIQDGYNTDILQPNRGQPTPPLPSGRDVESGRLVSSSQERLGSKEHFASREHVRHVPANVPFWRTTKGRIIMAVVAVVVIAAVVGGAVGGTRKKNKATFSEGSGQEGSAPEASTSGSPSQTSTSSEGVATQGFESAPVLTATAAGDGPGDPGTLSSSDLGSNTKPTQAPSPQATVAGEQTTHSGEGVLLRPTITAWFDQ